jgi:hypothetical protein
MSVPSFQTSVYSNRNLSFRNQVLGSHPTPSPRRGHIGRSPLNVASGCNQSFPKREALGQPVK